MTARQEAIEAMANGLFRLESLIDDRMLRNRAEAALDAALASGAVILKDQLEPVSGRQLLAMARNIVNQVLDEAETSVEKRQAINDHCDVFALSVLARVPVFVLREGETP